MIPISLSISGFISYRDPVEIDFTTFSLACISGTNGAGKSSILDAITWSLFGQARKRDDAIINAQSDRAEVTLTFDYEGNRYRVTRANPRGKSSLLEFHIQQANDGQQANKDWKPLSERTIRETQTRIEETLRLDYETFVNAAFFLQGKADQFTQQRPGDRKRILASILGLDVWENYRQRTVKRRKEIENEITALDGRLTEINAELGEEQSRKYRLTELETKLETLSQARSAQETVLANIKQLAVTLEEQRKLVDSLARGIDATWQRMNDLETRLDSRQGEKDSFNDILSQAEEIESGYQSWQAAREKLSQWDEIADQFREYEKKRQGPLTTIEAERARLTQEQKNLQEQEHATSGKQSTVSDLQFHIENLQSIISDFESQLESRKQLEVDLAAAQESLANIRAENPRLKTEMEEIKSRIDQLTETEGAACPLCGQPLNAHERQNLIEELNILGTSMGDKYRANRDLLKETGERVEGLKSQVKDLSALDDDLLNKKNQLNQHTNQQNNLADQIKQWENEGQPRLAEIGLQLQKETFASEARAELAVINAELKEIGYDAAEHDQIRQEERQGRATEDEFRMLERATAALKPLDDEISNLRSQINDLKLEIDHQQAAHDNAVSILAATETQAPDVRTAQRDLLDIQEQENRLRMEVGAAQQKVQVLGDLKTRRKTLEAERESFAQQVGQFKQLERAFGKDGVPALLIEQALPQIETKANEILERLSGGNMSVRFVTQREYKDKKRTDLKETLDIQISDSAGIRDYEMFSGGEAFRVNFAIRLALSEVLAQRAGARLQTLVIDEGFGSQDQIGRQRLIEAINTVKADFSKILVITHIEALKEAFPTRIEVEKTSRGSVVNIL